MKNRFVRKYLICCSAAFTFFANMLNGQNNLIPSTQNCSSQRPPFSFNISQKWSRSGVSNHTTPLAGDIDGDGKTEVLVTKNPYDAILVFDGQTGVSAGSINTGILNGDGSNPYVICDVEGDGKAEIFVVTTYGGAAVATLYTVTSEPGVRPITFGTKWTVNLPTDVFLGAQYGGAIPVVADLDGDGQPEFVVSYYIIETNGTIVPTKMNYRGGIVYSTYMCVSYVADLDADGIPEIIVGTDVYKYDGAIATLWKRCPSFPSGRDGTNMAADINLDGTVDLVYHDNDHNYAASMVIWTPSQAPAPGVSSTQGVIGSFPTISGYSCYPVVGDIDGIVTNGKKYPEICYNSQKKFVAYSFNGTSFYQKFEMPTNEISGLATFTFFDFNLDGIMELVYRDEQNLHIYNCIGDNLPIELYSMPATSGTLIETPIVADVTGDGSADIVVTGSGNIYVFEGASSKWASCPPIWNQQMYSNLLINTDLTVIGNVASASKTNEDCTLSTIRLYNGGPLQAPYVSAETFCPIDVSPDLYVISGSISLTGTTTANLTVTFGNQGLATAAASTPIRYYHTIIAPANIISAANTTLGTDLAPGQTVTITKSINFPPSTSQFYVRVIDDGVNFPAAGAYSDCNLTNNHKAFGTLELLKTANTQNACIDGTVLFTVKIKNNTDQVGMPQTFNNIVLTDSLGTGWQYVSSSVSEGTEGTYNSTTRKIRWDIPSLAPGDSARWTIAAIATSAGAIRNSSWIDEVDGTVLGREVIEAYVIVDASQAPAAAVISPATATLCSPSGVTLTASIAGKSSYQWYRNGFEISGATTGTYYAASPGNYTVTYFEAPCVSQMSAPATITENCIEAVDDRLTVFACKSKTVNVLANDFNASGGTLTIVKDGTRGTASPSSPNIVYANDKGDCTTHGGKRDTVIYRVCTGGSCSDANLYIDILRLPKIKLYDSCSRRPYLSLNYQYPGATYQWHSSNDGSTWTPIVGSVTTKLKVTQDARYKVSITYQGDTVDTVPVHFIVAAKKRLSGGLWWYVSSIE